MGKLLILTAVALAVSIVGMGILAIIYFDSQARLMSISKQLNDLELYVTNIGLLAYWKLDKNTGSSVNDDSSNGNMMSVENNPIWGSANQCAVGASCLQFDGIDDYLRGPEESMRIRGHWTVMAWMKLASYDSFNIVITKMGSSNGHVNYEMKIDEQGHLVCRSHNEDGENFQSASSESLSLETWYNIACEYDGNMLKGWINGTADGAVSITGQLCADCVIGTPGPVTIGHAGTESGCPNCESEYFKGTIDDVSVYSRALSGSEIRWLYERAL